MERGNNGPQRASHRMQHKEHCCTLALSCTLIYIVVCHEILEVFDFYSYGIRNLLEGDI